MRRLEDLSTKKRKKDIVLKVFICFLILAILVSVIVAICSTPNSGVMWTSMVFAAIFIVIFLIIMGVKYKTLK